ncbi:MAG TPA: DUF4126 domain-containing protein, partial [Anaerolineae bacterium]|nr:DUF4126 domain-containing protein [Anaerolineae bacterium]
MMDLADLPLDLAGLLALAAGLGWAAGLRLYTVVFVVGLAGHLGIADLPPGLRVLQHRGELVERDEDLGRVGGRR